MKNFHVDKCSYRMLFLVAACCVADLNHRECLLICREAGGTLLLERATSASSHKAGSLRRRRRVRGGAGNSLTKVRLVP